jgi:hypothetical protein
VKAARGLADLGRMFVGPACLYAAAFLILTLPAVLHFRTDFFCDAGDGLQNVWNLWWVRKAIVDLHQLPWHTTWLHFPHGTTLIGHTLNPINGLLALPLGFVLPLVVVHNLVVTLAFVSTGLATFWLCRRLGRAYWPSLAAGALFTFSEYHFAHAEGHMQLVTLQFVPLFLLAWVWLLDAPGLWRAAVCALALFAVLLGDHYYFAYSIGAALILLAWDLVDRVPLRRARIVAGLQALSLAALLSAPLLVGLAVTQAEEGFDGAHDARRFSMDVVALFVPGGHWAFRSLTEPVWSRIGDPNELAVHAGLPLLALAGLGAWKARRAEGRTAAWLTVAVLFFVFALGPALHFGGRILDVPMPYAWAEKALPILRLSGVPVRMMAMVGLALAVLAARGLEELSALSKPRRWALAGLLFVWSAVDLWPAPLPLTAAEPPAWVWALRAMPPGPVLYDDEAPYGLGLYYQTLYDKPRAGGFIARTPRSVMEQTDAIMAMVRVSHYAGLRRNFGFAYVVRRAPIDRPALRPLFEGDGVWIYGIELPGEGKP